MTTRIALVAAAAVLAATGSAGGQDIGEAPTFARLYDHTTLTTGRDVYTYWCWNCHGEGPGKPGTVALAARYKGAVPAVLTERTDLSTELVKVYVRTGLSIMPHFRKTQISDAQLKALAEYLARKN
jgi:mono/diheme cytochrome c family protein